MPKGVLFDMSQTIFAKSAIDYRSGFLFLVSEMSLHRVAPPDVLRDLLEDLRFTAFERFKSAELEFSFVNLCRLLCSQFGVDANVTDALEQGFMSAVWPDNSLEPGARETLDILADREVPLAVLSNSMFRSATLAGKFRECGILDRFRFVMSSADYGLRKPHPALFRAASARMSIPLEQLIYVGDSFQRDIIGAESAGMKAIWYNPRHEEAPAKCVQCDAWASLPSLIAQYSESL